MLGGIKLTLSLGCFPQNGFLMHSFAHENWKHVQRLHIMLSSASALRIWCRGGLIYAVGSPWLQPLPWCHEGWGHCCHYVSRRSRGPACLSEWAQVQGSGCNQTTLGAAEQRLIENMTVKSNRGLCSCLLRSHHTARTSQCRREHACFCTYSYKHVILIYNSSSKKKHHNNLHFTIRSY